MNESPSNLSAESLDLLPYQRAIVDHLKRVDPDVWKWFSKSASDPKLIEETRFELLKSTYRVDRDSQTELYETAGKVANVLGIDAPLTVYQAQNPSGLNASLA